MDPLTQGLLGAAAAQAVFTKHLGRSAAVIGLVGGMLADVDVLFSRWSDPALPQELHRHFTHALAFIPIGGFLAALPFFCFAWCRRRYRHVLGAAVLAYATHGLLDTCTSYGTHLLWPFSNARLSWDLIAIIDPAFSVTLLLGVLVVFARSRARPAAICLAIAVSYLGLCVIQHERCRNAQAQLAESRGHTIEHARVMPTLGNTLVWRCVYIADGRIHADAVRAGLGRPTVKEGASVALFAPEDVPPAMIDRSRIVDVLTRFSRFADGYTALAPQHGAVVADMRYSLDTARFAPMWGVWINASNPFDPVAWVGLPGGRREALVTLWEEVARGWPTTATTPTDTPLRPR